MFSRLDIITPPATSPVSLTEAKAFARIDFNDDDATVAQLIDTAVEHVQTVTGRALAPTTYSLTLGEFPRGELPLPIGPVTEVQSIAYLDRDGAPQTFTDFRAYLAADRPHLEATRWPATSADPEAVVVTFVAGYETPPERARLAILALVAHWYEHRLPVAEGRTAELPHHVTRLVNGTRNWAQV